MLPNKNASHAFCRIGYIFSLHLITYSDHLFAIIIIKHKKTKVFSWNKIKQNEFDRSQYLIFYKTALSSSSYAHIGL